MVYILCSYSSNFHYSDYSKNLFIFEISTLFCFWLLFLSCAEIGRFVVMLRNPSPILKSCAAFALLQVTVPTCLVSIYIHFGFWLPCMILSFNCSLQSLVDDTPCTMPVSCRTREQQEFYAVLLPQQLHLLKQKSLPGLFFAISNITKWSIQCRLMEKPVVYIQSKFLKSFGLCAIPFPHMHNYSKMP